MLETALTAHEPLLVNTVGHSLGALLFGLSLYFLKTGSRASRLSIAAAALALVWNVASLLVLAAREEHWPGLAFLIALSTSALSGLPAVLLHLSFGDRFRGVVIAGYVLGGAAVVMHATEHLFASHRDVLLLTTIGFAALTVIATAGMLRQGRVVPRQVLAAMALFLFAISLVHVDAGEAHEAWSIELLVHHAGVPLALLVLLQDYRFVLLDAFVRVLTSLVLASGVMALAWPFIKVPMPQNPIRGGLLLVAVSVGLALYALVSIHLQRLLTGVLFRRPDLEITTRRLQTLCGAAGDETELIAAGTREIAGFFQASLRDPSVDPGEIRFPQAVADLPAAVRPALEQAGVEVVVPLWLGSGEVRYAMLGARRGGRRYLSEDLQAAERLATQVTAHVEHFRETEMRHLVTEAELRALESQIHPHFLFNALNTLYGVIPREAAGARRTVLNLADILRYFLRVDSRYIPLEEELAIVEAYLEIEKLRLGVRLRTHIDVDPKVRRTPIPVLSLQPLVENAVKHAIASQSEGGEVRIAVRLDGDSISVRVADTGPGFGASTVKGQGVGLQNVQRRLKLCYGPDAELHIDSHPTGASVGFDVPLERAAV
jgi:two-component system LytT family sensor kinase